MKSYFKNFVSIAILSTFVVVTGCGSLMGGLRKDLDDQDYSYSGPTTGGRWSERGMLDDEDARGNPYSSVGHSDRGPASMSMDQKRGGALAGGSWVSPEDRSALERDRIREEVGPTYSDEPNLPPPTRRAYKNGNRATKSDFVDEANSEGSLWASDGQTNYYFTKNKIRGVGDIVTITVEKDLFKDIKADVTRSLNPREREVELADAQVKLKNQANGGGDQVKGAQAAPARTPASKTPATTEKADEKKDADKVREATFADVDVTSSLGIKEGDTVMGEIIERYPNGNYKIKGTKRIPYRNGYRTLNLVAISKSSDIGEDDTIPSGKLYEYRIETYR